MNNMRRVIVHCFCSAAVLCMFGAHAPAAERKPDNAALLYYQAFLMAPDISDDNALYQEVLVAFGNRSGGNVAALRKYAEKHQHLIQLLEAASKLPHCNWAVRGSPRDVSELVRLNLEHWMRCAGEVIRARVRVLAADGDYRTAFSQCLMLRRMAWRIGDDPPFYFNPGLFLSYQFITLREMRSVLEIMSPDEKTLRWLIEQLGEAPRMSDVMLTRLKQSYEVWLSMDAAAAIPDIRRKLAEKAADEKKKKEALALTDEAILELVREPYEKFYQSYVDTLDSDMPYEQKVDRSESLRTEYGDQAENNPAIIRSLLRYPGAGVEVFYNLAVVDDRLCNAYGAAVEIYLLRATTGRLPQTLPDGLPKDPITGEDFKYKVTDDGFVLGHPYKYAGGGFKEFRFKVRQ